MEDRFRYSAVRQRIIDSMKRIGVGISQTVHHTSSKYGRIRFKMSACWITITGKVLTPGQYGLGLIGIIRG